MKNCKAKDCEYPARTKGFCTNHYMMWLRYGDDYANHKTKGRHHFLTNTPEHQSWRGMIDRCQNKKHIKYDRYGGRGIKVCDRWKNKEGFINFLADMGKRPKGKTLDRINNDGNYEPSNCRWITQREQIANSTTTKIQKTEIPKIKSLIDKGLRHREIAQMYGVTRGRISMISRGEY